MLIFNLIFLFWVTTSIVLHASVLKKHIGFHILSSVVLVSSQTPEPADRAAVLKQFLCAQIATRYNLCNSGFCGREEFVQTFGFFYFRGIFYFHGL